MTLGQFFTVWGVRFDANCLGATCGELEVTTDGKPATDPSGLVLYATTDVQIRITSAA